MSPTTGCAMDMHEYFRLLVRYWRSITAAMLVVVAAVAGFTLLQPRTWTGTASLYVAVESGTAGELSQGANYAERQVKSFVEVARSPFALQPVIDQLELDSTPQQLGQSISVAAPANTSVIDISSTRRDPLEAAAIANALADSLAVSVDELSPKARDGERLVQATVIERSVIPTVPTSPRPMQNLALGVLLGALLGLGQALVRDRLDTRVRSVSDLARVTDAAVIGTIARHNPDSPADENGYSVTDEAFRALRTNLGFLGLAGERRPSVVFTSSVAAEGKTETATRLARSLAAAGERVLLVDADLRRPKVADRLGLEGSAGLSHVLSGQASAWDLVQPGGAPGLDVLAAGTVPPNPAELLGSEAMERFVRAAEDRYDHVLLDAPPLLPVTDAAVLAHQTGGAVVVARSGVVSRHEIAAALASLDAAGGDVLGIVLNDVTKRSGTGVYGGYYYYHRDGGARRNHEGPAMPIERVPESTKESVAL